MNQGGLSSHYYMIVLLSLISTLSPPLSFTIYPSLSPLSLSLSLFLSQSLLSVRTEHWWQYNGFPHIPSLHIDTEFILALSSVT